MKKIFVGILALGILGFAFTLKPKAANEVKVDQVEKAVGVDFFHGTWAEALAKAEKENKLIFLDAYTDWCGWCKRLDATTLKDKAVGDFFNENFINVHMEMEKSKEGPRLAKKMSIRGYPALFFINGKEEVKHFVAGYVKSDRLINEGSTALKKK
jgi:thiol:disulfide interchange protein